MLLIHSAYYLSDTVLNTPYVFTRLILTTTLIGEFCFYPHFTNKETEARRD